MKSNHSPDGVIKKKLKYFCQHYLLRRQYLRLYPGNRVVEHLPYDPKIEGLSPATATGRQIMAKVISLCSITLYYLSLTGALTRESALKVNDLLTNDLVSTSHLKPSISKLFSLNTSSFRASCR
jgi:hypothetical protein